LDLPLVLPGDNRRRGDKLRLLDILVFWCRCSSELFSKGKGFSKILLIWGVRPGLVVWTVG
jgi:hypothetical protein